MSAAFAQAAIDRGSRRAAFAAFALACCLLICAAASFAAAGVKTPQHERVQLPNGAVVLLTEQREVPMIAFTALIRGGAMTDPPDQFGSATLLASLLEKGAGKRDALAFAETVASVGGVIETSAALESIAVSGSFLARDRELMIELLADMLQRPHLANEQFEAMRARHIEFLRAAKDSDLAALTPLYGASALFPTHPYGRPVSGSEASLAGIELAELKRFYDQQVGADRLILSIAGDFKTADMKRLITRAFGSWRKAGAALPTPSSPTAPAERRVLLVDAPESVQSYFWAGSLGVPRGDPRRAALDVVNTLFGGRFTSMLNSELRIRTGLSYGASARFDRMQHGGRWEMSSFTQTEKTIDAIELAFATLDKLHAGGLDPAMLDSGKTYVLGQFPLNFETAAHWAAQLANLELYGLDRGYIDEYGARLANVSGGDAQAVIRDVLPKSDEVVLVVIGNASAIREELKRFGPIVEMKLSDPTFALPSAASRE